MVQLSIGWFIQERYGVQMKKLLLAATALVAISTAAYAEHCDGILQKGEDGLFLGPLPTRHEGTCVILKPDEEAVLRVCRVGDRCIISGLIRLCTDIGINAGECVAVLKVTGVKRVTKIGANADLGTCLKLDDENSTAVTVSGRVTMFHQTPKGSELRAADGPFLMLDQPLLVDMEAGDCKEWRKIAILVDDNQSQTRRWANQHVIIEGKLGRFGSALVSPAIFIEITTIKKN